MTLFLEQCLNGLQFGLLLFLLAAGLTLVFGIMDLVNLAHGSLYMLGAYFAATFSAWTGSGTPRAGVHGELLLVRASIEARIGWDFGPRSLVEDAQFALIFSARYPGRSAWFCGRCYGASPASLRDFFR